MNESPASATARPASAAHAPFARPAPVNDAAPDTSAPAMRTVKCPRCGAPYRIHFKSGIRRARCQNCQNVFELPIEG